MLKTVSLTRGDLYPSEKDTPIRDLNLGCVAYDRKTFEAISAADSVIFREGPLFVYLSNKHGSLTWGNITTIGEK